MTSILTLATSASAVQHPRCCYMYGIWLKCSTLGNVPLSRVYPTKQLLGI